MTTDSILSQEPAGFPGTGDQPACVCPTSSSESGVYGPRPVCGCAQSGFTLVEAALILVIIAILIGGILKGWQMVQSTRVRRMAETVTSVQSAFFAFHDRYGRVAGDWNAVDAGNAIGATVNGGGNDSGHLDTTPGSPWAESNAFWEQLANDLAPMNVFQRPIMIGRTSDFEGATASRRHVVVGRGAPAGALRELDTKLDDGKADQGTVRATVDDAAVSVFVGANRWGGRNAACVDAAGNWDPDDGSDDCNALMLF